MKKYLLCRSCAARFGKSKFIAAAPESRSCFICSGLASKPAGLCRIALAAAGKSEWRTFSVASSFPKKVFIAEEEVADCFRAGGFTSIKNSVNASLISEIARASKRKNSQREADAAFEFDFAGGKAHARFAPVLVFGHYTKLSRRHCQSRWHCSGCGGRGCPSCRGSGMNYPSIEDELGRELMALFGASSCTLHACGREDVDVRMLGNGRPFVMELFSPGKRSADLRAAEARLAKKPARARARTPHGA